MVTDSSSGENSKKNGAPGKSPDVKIGVRSLLPYVTGSLGTL